MKGNDHQVSIEKRDIIDSEITDRFDVAFSVDT
jgi:hypothetical protein